MLRRQEQGFSLVELMVGLAIMVILAAIAVPSFINQQKSAVDGQTKIALEAAVGKVDAALLRSPGAEVAVQRKGSGNPSMGEGYLIIKVGDHTETLNVKSKTLVVNTKTIRGGNYKLAAFDSTGKKYDKSSNALIYNSQDDSYKIGTINS